MDNETLTDERLSEIVYETETIGVAAVSHGELVAIAHELRIERAKVKRLEAMVTMMDRNLGDERRAHEVEIEASDKTIREYAITVANYEIGSDYA